MGCGQNPKKILTVPCVGKPSLEGWKFHFLLHSKNRKYIYRSRNLGRPFLESPLRGRDGTLIVSHDQNVGWGYINYLGDPQV